MRVINPAEGAAGLAASLGDQKTNLQLAIAEMNARATMEHARIDAEKELSAATIKHQAEQAEMDRGVQRQQITSADQRAEKELAAQQKLQADRMDFDARMERDRRDTSLAIEEARIKYQAALDANDSKAASALQGEIVDRNKKLAALDEETTAMALAIEQLKGDQTVSMKDMQDAIETEANARREMSTNIAKLMSQAVKLGVGAARGEVAAGGKADKQDVVGAVVSQLSPLFAKTGVGPDVQSAMENLLDRLASQAEGKTHIPNPSKPNSGMPVQETLAILRQHLDDDTIASVVKEFSKAMAESGTADTTAGVTATNAKGELIEAKDRSKSTELGKAQTRYAGAWDTLKGVYGFQDPDDVYKQRTEILKKAARAVERLTTGNAMVGDNETITAAERSLGSLGGLVGESAMRAARINETTRKKTANEKRMRELERELDATKGDIFSRLTAGRGAAGEDLRRSFEEVRKR